MQVKCMFYIFFKLEFSISSDSTDTTVNRTMEFFLITLHKSMTRQGIVPQGVNKIPPKHDSPGMIPWPVKLTGI